MGILPRTVFLATKVGSEKPKLFQGPEAVRASRLDSGQGAGKGVCIALGFRIEG